MNPFPFRCPTAPGWNVDWPALTEEFEWIRAMRECPQDALFHAEGTVWTHVGMVATLLAGLEEFRALPDFTTFEQTARAIRERIFKQLLTQKLGESKREVFYPFGAAEGLLLDKVNPRWKSRYFVDKFDLRKYFPDVK